MTDDFASTFDALRTILAPHGPEVIVTADEPTHYYLDTAHICKNKKPLFFGAARVGKAYVSFHLMPVYIYTDLLDAESPALRKRRQGKSCWNFTRVEPKLFAELERLTAAGFAR